MTENSNLWAVFTTDTFTPFLEFDFIGNDTWTNALGFTEEELSVLNTGDKLELRKHYVEAVGLNKQCAFPCFRLINWRLEDCE